MQFWKDHKALRLVVILFFFLTGLALVVWGWTITGKLAGLGIMVLGLIFLLTALMVYNKPFQSLKKDKRL